MRHTLGASTRRFQLPGRGHPAVQPDARRFSRCRSESVWDCVRFAWGTDRSHASVSETRTAVIAIGGNALSPPGEHSTIADQFRHTRDSLGPIVDLALDGWRVVVVHGNGPQVGDELVRNEKARSEVAPLPLGVLVAGTAGWIGYMLQQSLENALRKAGNSRDVVTVLTQVEVAADDPALQDPKKFIGHGISIARARELRAEGHPVKKDAKGRFRRVVGSPKPLAIHELGTIRSLVERDTVVIACGGGGISRFSRPGVWLSRVECVGGQGT